MFEALTEVSRLPKHGRGLSFGRLRAAFGPLWNRVTTGADTVHVVGSNGKGSTAAFLEALLRRRGLRTGLFTSPHYYRFEERYQLDGQPVSEEQLEAAWRYFQSRDGDGFGGFEAMTVMAAHVFSEQSPDVIVVEAGIGGRYDPTRMFRGKLGILTSVDIEHGEILGQTAKEIAADKLDAVMPGGLVIHGWLDNDLTVFLEEYASLAGRALRDVGTNFSIDADRFAKQGTVVVDVLGRRIDYHIPTAYFVKNSLLALSAARELLARRHLTQEGLEEDFIDLCRTFGQIGRFERLSKGPPIYCDVAHTPGAIRELIESCRSLFPEGPPIFVLGMSHDKHLDEMCHLLARYGSDFLLSPAHHKGAPPARLDCALRETNPAARATIFNSPGAVANYLIDAPYGPSRPIVATGGLFSSIEFRTTVLNRDPAALRFF